MEAVGRKGWWPAMEHGSGWVSVTMRTLHGPSWVEEEFEQELRYNGWEVNFKANWWSPAEYGVAIFEAEKNGRSKVLVVKWAVGHSDEVVKVEEKDRDEGRLDFFSMVDMVSDNLMYDPVLRSMMDRY